MKRLRVRSILGIYFALFSNPPLSPILLYLRLLIVLDLPNFYFSPLSFTIVFPRSLWQIPWQFLHPLINLVKKLTLSLVRNTFEWALAGSLSFPPVSISVCLSLLSNLALASLVFSLTIPFFVPPIIVVAVFSSSLPHPTASFHIWTELKVLYAIESFDITDRVTMTTSLLSTFSGIVEVRFLFFFTLSSSACWSFALFLLPNPLTLPLFLSYSQGCIRWTRSSSRKSRRTYFPSCRKELCWMYPPCVIFPFSFFLFFPLSLHSRLIILISEVSLHLQITCTISHLSIISLPWARTKIFLPYPPSPPSSPFSSSSSSQSHLLFLLHSSFLNFSDTPPLPTVWLVQDERILISLNNCTTAASSTIPNLLQAFAQRFPKRVFSYSTSVRLFFVVLLLLYFLISL